MNILLTNDDGIRAEGLDSLYRVLSERHRVYAIAPDSEKSACSNAITVRTEIHLENLDEFRYSVNAYPADCVNIGLNGTIIPEIDLVISGINHGPNVGDDIFFSGTVAGARTAYIFGKTGIAVSVDSYHRPSVHFDDASRFVMDFIDEISGEMAHKPLFFNINYPDLPRDRIKGVRYTFSGKRIYNDSFMKTKVESGAMKLEVSGVINSVDIDGSDAKALHQGYISITPMTLECTDMSYLKKRFTGIIDSSKK
ncbi:MAG TPA: 5'/3'-nucleotidase SurE [Spirochaetota bacterium]|nr:5'/3'-nucleotidase SurE [Spirochaetota bacterium]HRZ26223.1 5'/3'-nucleotidase SurE [Spirochaetota bacterium]HSA14645.1 5'/3'-nucleotidase SurE [Spirochaetota bacterium]